MADFSDSDLHKLVIANSIAEVLSALGSAASRVNEKDGNGYTPLMLAAGYGHAEMACALLQRYPPMMSLDERSSSGFTALALAADRGHSSIVSALLDAGADARLHCGSGRYTALHLAAKSNNYNVMELLLKHGKRKQSDLQMVQAVTTDGRTPLAIYCSNKNNANFNSNSDTIDKNAEAINRVLTLLLSDYGSSVDLSDTNGLTPLMHAALIAEAPLVRLLLQRFGADAARTSDQEGCTAEAFASRRGYVDIVHILNEHSSNDRR